MSKPKPINPRRGEVWEINLDWTTGSEHHKSQPAVVISSDALNCLSARLVVPIATWKDDFSGTIWIVAIKPNDTNGLEKDSAVDAMQIRGVNVNHFISRLGKLSANDMEEISAAFDAVVECQ